MEQSGSSPATASGRIFMSYRRQETAYATGWLFDRLAERYGRQQIFKDVDSLQPGDDFVAVIQAAVGSCAVLLALIGDEWLSVVDASGRRRIDDPNDFVRLEIEAALSRGVRVIPILVDGARMPQPAEVPDSLAPLVRRQALELSPARFDFDLSQLVAVLDRTLTPASGTQDAGSGNHPPQDGSPVESATTTGNPPHGQGRRTATVGLALAVVAAVGALLVALALLRPDGSDSSSASSNQPGRTRSSTEQGRSTPSSAAAQGSTTAVRGRTTTSGPAGSFVVKSQGRIQLSDPLQGLDLESGKPVGVLQSHLGWNALARRLFVFDATTLGARVIENTSFGDVRGAQLASTDYGQGEDNPSLSPEDLPVGRVLAVHVDDRTFAKVSVLRYDPDGALDLRWITFRAS